MHANLPGRRGLRSRVSGGWLHTGLRHELELYQKLQHRLQLTSPPFDQLAEPGECVVSLNDDGLTAAARGLRRSSRHPR